MWKICNFTAFCRDYNAIGVVMTFCRRRCDCCYSIRFELNCEVLAWVWVRVCMHVNWFEMGFTKLVCACVWVWSMKWIQMSRKLFYEWYKWQIFRQYTLTMHKICIYDVSWIQSSQMEIHLGSSLSVPLSPPLWTVSRVLYIDSFAIDAAGNIGSFACYFRTCEWIWLKNQNNVTEVIYSVHPSPFSSNGKKSMRNTMNKNSSESFFYLGE